MGGRGLGGPRRRMALPVPREVAISQPATSHASRTGGAALTRVGELESRPENNIEASTSLSEGQLDEVVHQLNGICRSSSLEFALRIGALIIQHFYGGKTEVWRDRGPKLHSFRRLAEHPELTLSAGALYRCVAIFEMCERLRAPARWQRLGASHLRAVVGIPAEKQEYLLTKANNERWSVQVLQAEAQGLRTGRNRGGRRASSRLGKHIRALDRCLQDWGRSLDSMASSQPEELQRSLELLEKMKAAVEQLTWAVEAQRNRLT